jgi:hypothetical protein
MLKEYFATNKQLRTQLKESQDTYSALLFKYNIMLEETKKVRDQFFKDEEKFHKERKMLDQKIKADLTFPEKDRYQALLKQLTGGEDINNINKRLTTIENYIKNSLEKSITPIKPKRKYTKRADSVKKDA